MGLNIMSRISERQFFAARKWSNTEIRKLGPFFEGDAINVSGWNDRDKEGGRYREYFTNVTSYAVSNFAGERGIQDEVGEIFIDLEAPLPPNLRLSYDLVFNHTTLEHVFDVRRAFSNLCEMSRNAVLIVVPWAQVVLSNSSFGDYWRFSPEAVRRLFEAEGFTPLYISGSPMQQAAIYVVGLGVRDSGSWQRLALPSALDQIPLGNWIGSPSFAFKLLRRIGLHKTLKLAPRDT